MGSGEAFPTFARFVKIKKCVFQGKRKHSGQTKSDSCQFRREYLDIMVHREQQVSDVVSHIVVHK